MNPYTNETPTVEILFLRRNSRNFLQLKLPFVY